MTTCPFCGDSFNDLPQHLARAFRVGAGPMKSKLKFKLVFKRGGEIVAEVKGRDGFAVPEDAVKAEDIQAIEQNIERLTGLRVHVEQVHE